MPTAHPQIHAPHLQPASAATAAPSLQARSTHFESSPNPAAQRIATYAQIANSPAPIQRQAAPQGGLPANLKSGIEGLSGIAMDDVRVHYNSSKPAQLQAHAYAQGTDIHIAPGQERHLPHEAWHVVQQKQGRVKPTLQLKGVAINDDSALEREADVMGGRAMGGLQTIQGKFETFPSRDERADQYQPITGMQELPLAQQKVTEPTIQQKSYGNDKIAYETENFTLKNEDSQRERVCKVVISGRDKRNNLEPDTASSFYNEDEKEWEDMEGYHKGHVAAREFGGSSSHYNIVPMLPNFNTGLWKVVESHIDTYIGKNTITITPKYAAKADQRVPSSFNVDIAGVKNQNVNHDVPERGGFNKKDMDFFGNAAKDVNAKSYALQVLADAYKKGWIHSNYLNSPYLPLDIAWLNGLEGSGNPGSRKSYESWQIDWLIRYNRGLNNNNILSDAWMHNTNEPHQILYEAGRKSRPEADHIVPQSRGGANLFTNARLVSWELNNSIERVVDASRKFIRW